MTLKSPANHKPNNRDIDRLIEVIDLFREQRPMLPIQTASVFLLIARYPGIRLNELMKITGLSQASVSRNVSTLCKFDRQGAPGMDLVKRTMDLKDPRVQRLKLTKKGTEFLTTATLVGA